MRRIIYTEKAPKPIGNYSQAICVGNTFYLAGQIPLDPLTMELVDGGIEAQIVQVLQNLRTVCQKAGGHLDNIVKLSIFLKDLAHAPLVNTAMAEYFNPPYPARTTLGVADLPKGSLIEIDAIMVLDEHSHPE